MRSPADRVSELLSLYANGQFAKMESRVRGLLDASREFPILEELLGMALAAQGRYADALAPLQKAARLVPTDAQFWENLGLCQRQLQAFAAAEASLRKSLALRPNSPDTWNALGSVLRSLRCGEEALAMFRQALSQNPRHYAAEVNCGNTLRDLGRIAEAEASYRRAVAIEPENPRAHCYRGIVLNDAGRQAEAKLVAEQALQLIGSIDGKISAADLHSLDIAAMVFEGAKDHAAATSIYRATLAQAHTPERALAALVAARNVCDWELARTAEAALETLRAAQNWSVFSTITPFRLLMATSATPSDQLAAALNFAGRFTTKESSPIARPAARASTDKRLRIGYFSGDFCDHPISHLLVGIIEAHDRTRFEIVAYDYSPPAKDEFRQRLEKAFDRVVSMHGLSYRQAGVRMAQDHCDIVVDLTGWTGQTRSPALAARPAPLQMQWLGYSGTMGAPWIDYLVADRVVVPPGEESSFSEKLIRLPDSFQPNDDKRAVARATDRRQHGLPPGGFVFCSFNQAFKITSDIFPVWMRLLKAVNDSVLWLQHDARAVEPLRRHAAEHGVEPQRLLFAPRVPLLADHLERIGHADLGLDCFPYGSHTTASDVLWAGVPLLALRGETFASRVSSSVLAAAGLPDLITTSLEDYFQCALRLATNPADLATLRMRTRRCRESALFDTRLFTRNLEAAYRLVWNRHRSGLSPDHIDVDSRESLSHNAAW